MTTDRFELRVQELCVAVARKPIKNLHISVRPPDGHVRVSAPQRMSKDAIRLAVASRLTWIHRKQKAFRAQPRESAREMVTGESHWFRGRRYRLDVRETTGRTAILITGNRIMTLYARPDADTAARARVLERFHRAELKARIPALLDTWQPVIGERVSDCRVKRMKTRWGSCNIGARRIWLNLDLIRKPPECLEYVLVHEMVHLLERNHTPRFRALMDGLLPDWRMRRDQLNAAPLAHDDWSC